MPAPSSPPATETYSHIIARTLRARFSTRPTLRSVTGRLLKDLLLERYPQLAFDPTLTRLAQPGPEGGWRIALLVDVVLTYLATGTPPVLSEQFGLRCFLTNNVPTHLSTDKTIKREPDMLVIAEIIRELPATVFVAFQEALTQYWNEQLDGAPSRWQWLGDLLNGVLKTAAVRQSSLNPLHADILIELARHPDKQERVESPWANGVIQACIVETTLTKGQRSVSVQSPDLLVMCGQTVLLCSVAGRIESFSSLDAFGQVWGARYGQAFEADAIGWKRYEPDGNIFDTQAAVLLNQQLEDLETLKLPAGLDLEALERRFEATTDVAASFLGLHTEQTPNPTLLQRTEATTPEWLRTASGADQMAYRKQVLALAGIKRQNIGRTFQTGIDDLHTFTKKALHAQMLEDQPLAPGYDADELELTFQVPVGDLGNGYLEPVKMSLTELAIKNLASKPKGRMTIRHTGDQLIQDWTTDAYLLDLVSRVDIGKRYPELIRSQLLGDTPEAHERRRLFGLELSVQLPTLALEQSIKAKQGFTRQGYRYVDAVMQRTTAERVVDGRAIVLRALAFQRKAGADCDVVSNMFIIEPKALTADGPHILYRPLYSPALLQYPTRQALLSAIAQPGSLQSSVLTWLPDRARPIYDNNGFNEPHIVYVHPGDEFARPEKPKPAMLAGDEASVDWLTALSQGRLLASLYNSNARMLVELADRQTVSDAESRWAIILEGGWLVFNNLLLPLARGPAMLAGWMLQLTQGLIQDLPALDSKDATAREQAWVDVLLNLGLVLLHLAHPRSGVIDGPLALAISHTPPLTLTPLRNPQPPLRMPTETLAVQATPGLPSEPPGSGNTLLDFNLSTARDSTTARLFEKLLAVQVPWPASLPQPVATGPFKGLYKINDKWHATLAALLFQVQIEPGIGEVFLVHPQHPDHPGIKLKTDGNGKWSLDQGLKLVGGGPKRRIAAEREKRQQRIETLNLQLLAFGQEQDRVQKRVDIADRLMTLKLESATTTEAERTSFRQRYIVELDKQTETYVVLVADIKEKSTLTDLPLDYTLIGDVLGNIVKNLRKRVVIADLERNDIELHYSDYTSGDEQLLETARIEGEIVVQRFFEFIGKISVINENMITSFEEIDRRTEQLRQIPLLGAKTLEALNEGRGGNELTTLRVKAYQLTILRILSIKDLDSHILETLKIIIEPLQIRARSHAELRTAHVYERSDRIAVLENLVAHYKKAQGALGGISIFSADDLQAPPFNRLRFLIHELCLDAEQLLADEIQQLVSEQENTSAPSSSEAPGPSKGPGAGTQPPKSPLGSVRRKKVIKTSKGTLIGEIRPRIANQGGDIVDINEPMQDRPLASFHEHEPDVWVEIVDAPTPTTKSASSPYPQLKGEARKALSNVDEQVRKIEGYASDAGYPKEIEEQLQREAQKLSQYAEGLEKHPDAPPANEKDTTLIAELREKAQSLEIKGTQLRIRMTLAQSPTSEGAYYLLQHNALFAKVVGRRVQLKTGRQDFMQEYALIDTHNQAVWYAHFHYAGMADEKASFTTAHLKTPAQRFETYESALAKAKDPQQKIQIYHGVISSTLAAEYFLPLEPR